jgi:ssDNA-binding Zn-finger/Zn-ribbon topoisomerase 1
LQADITNLEHVQNIRQTKREIIQGVCPRCGGELVEKDGKYGKFYGCSNFPECKFTKKIK